MYPSLHYPKGKGSYVECDSNNDEKSYKRLHFAVTFITLTQIPYGPVPRVASGVGEAS